MIPACLLCHKNLIRQYFFAEKSTFYQCTNCSSVFKDPAYFPTVDDEKERYLEHENNVDDPRYQAFVAPIVDYISQQFENSSHGLDFGAGTGPVISKILKDRGYDIVLYDPFFYPEKAVLDETYDFIICCEVIEHFHHPSKEFLLLRKLLKPNGKLICMTELLPKRELFEKWYYKNDPTHVVFYSEQNLEWIQENFGFSEVMIDNRLIVFEA